MIEDQLQSPSAEVPAAPAAGSAGIRRSMQGNRRRDTSPEMRLRRLLHARGLRYRVDQRLDLEDCRPRPDIVFASARVCVFVDGCFWHRCPDHGNDPNSNKDYWQPKLERNVDRDRRYDAALKRAGWIVLRMWEHEDPREAAERIAGTVAAALARRAG